MCQPLHEDKNPCGQTSGWNEREGQPQFNKHRWKKRKKISMISKSILGCFSHKQASSLLLKANPRLPSLPRMLSYLLIVIQFLSFANSQVIVDHPKSRHNRRSLDQNSYNQHQLYTPTTKDFHHKTNEDHRTLFNPKKLSEYYASENITNLSSLPASREKQNELVRRLSSTMLLETLLRHPFLPRRLPFPVNMDVSTTNRTTTTNSNFIHRDKLFPSYELKQSMNNTDNSFNASSLNYLVEKLLSSKPFENLQPKRPLNRHRSPYESELSLPAERDSKVSVSPQRDLKHAIKSPVTLDMLIKDEYDLRVKPLIKSLIAQEKLATGKDESSRLNNSANTVPTNHKLDTAGSVPTSTLSPFDDRPNIMHGKAVNHMPTLTPSLTIFAVEPNNSNTLIAFEDSDEYEESDEDADDSKVLSNDVKESMLDNKSKEENGKKKTLHNVPPYQLSDTSLELQPKPRPAPPKLNLPTVTVASQATTKNSMLDQDGTTTATTTITPKSLGDSASSKEAKITDKATDASMRGSLIYSDGVEDEAEKAANRRRKQQARRESLKAALSKNHLTRNNQAMTDRKSDTHQDEKPGSSFLLNQLFSTVNPLVDLDMKLKEQQAMKNIKDSDIRNPLVYKGYVGKDDYLISSSARDWSRPIGVRDNLARPMYRYTTTTTTTPAPPTDPPFVPYNYFLHQPVTNAQSVPTMVIPTSDPPKLTTQTPPMTSTHAIASDIEQNWSPTKVVQMDGLKPIQKRRQQGLDQVGPQGAGNRMNSSSPRLVSMTGLTKSTPIASSPLTETNHTRVKVLITNGLDGNGDILKNVSYGDEQAGSSRSRQRLQQNGFFVAKSGDGGLMGDIANEQVSVANRRKKPATGLQLSNGHPTRHAMKPVSSNHGNDSDDDNDESEEAEQDDDDVNHQRRKVFGVNAVKRLRDRMHSLDNMDGVRDESRYSRQNKTSKRHNSPSSSPADNHEPAGSEIQLSGLDKNQHTSDNKRTNRTTNNLFINLRQLPTRLSTTETVLIDGNDNSSSSTTAATTSLGSPATSGSTIIPNSNFYGAASSESPTLDNTIPVLNGGHTVIKVNQQHKHPSASNSEDPYQGSSNNVLSTMQTHSSSASPAPNPYKPQTTPPTQATTTKSDEANNKTSSTKSSNDRLAFILIGGSCALSVVCLVLAAMSMRCQDMCDDYRSLRNAERAAIKLQKHRLKYTKNHQINRFDHGRNSPNTGQIEDLNKNNNSAVSDPEINHSRITNLKCSSSGNGKSNQFESNLNAWNSSNCQVPLSAFLDKQEVCRCANCISHRWSCQDDIMINGGKQHSWLHPYYYMQQHARLRPLFGAGSSVGTFFPRRVDDQSFLAAGGPIDAQILIDNQPSHACTAADQRGLARSKSILQKNNKRSGLGGSNLCDISNFACENLDHNHSHHICNNHHKYNMETSISDDSKLTLDDSILCDSAKCSANHHQRHKLIQLRSNNAHNNSHQTAWKLGSTRKSTQNHHRHHHQQQSSSDGSIAQCTCSRDHQPLLPRDKRQQDRTSRKHLFKHDSRQSLRQKAKRDKAMLIWSTNRDQLI